MTIDKDTIIAQLTAEIAALTTDSSYGCLTRAGLERQWQPGGAVVFGDIDGMHELNARHGYELVNELIASALVDLQTRQDTLLAGRWYSGDELVWTLPTEDATAFAHRVLHSFHMHGLSITLGVAEAGQNLAASVAEASTLVQAAKQHQNGRGKVYTKG